MASDRAPTLRSNAFVDRRQPQCAAHIAATSPGDVPPAGMAEPFIELAPGNEVFRSADIAIAANEAEKHANVTVLELRAVGRFGRMFLPVPRARCRAPGTPPWPGWVAVHGKETR